VTYRAPDPQDIEKRRRQGKLLDGEGWGFDRDTPAAMGCCLAESCAGAACCATPWPCGVVALLAALLLTVVSAALNTYHPVC
jgi:hypothetical protein